MKQRTLLLIVLVMLLFLSSCSKVGKNSSFCIQFIDVGQGDSALVECDGHYMLIDGGDKSAGEKMKSVLIENNVKKLDYLVLSHLHADHVGGLIEGLKALRGDNTIGKTLSNSTYVNTTTFLEFEHELTRNHSQIQIPKVGEEFSLGRAKIKILDVCGEEENDSLVLLITYGKTRFLFTGDIEETSQRRIIEKYANLDDEPFKIDLVKMPHHGSDKSEINNIEDSTGSLYVFLRTFMPKYAIISVGENNKYGHPGERTLSELRDLGSKIYRTDINGDIIVKSNGKELSIKPKNSK